MRAHINWYTNSYKIHINKDENNSNNFQWL